MKTHRLSSHLIQEVGICYLMILQMVLKVNCVPFSVCLPKSQQPGKGHKVNPVMHPFCHPMIDIYMAVIVEGCMELSYDLCIPVILESHRILHLKLVNHLKHLFHFRLVKVPKVLPIYPLHLSDPWLAQTHR
jgi:hypothetical protein